jgi:multidrug transporter EmrE-like cation transporter
MPPLLWMFVGGIIVTVGDIIFKFWAEQQSAYLFVAGILVYLTGTLFLIQSFRTTNIAVASMIFIIFNIIALTLVSWFYFDEKLSTLQLVGLVLALGSVALLELGK